MPGGHRHDGYLYSLCVLFVVDMQAHALNVRPTMPAAECLPIVGSACAGNATRRQQNAARVQTILQRQLELRAGRTARDVAINDSELCSHRAESGVTTHNIAQSYTTRFAIDNSRSISFNEI